MNCDNCKKKNLQFSELRHEMEQTRLERINFALLMTLIITIILLFASCIYFLKYKSKIEMIILEETENGIILQDRNQRVSVCSNNFNHYYS